MPLPEAADPEDITEHWAASSTDDICPHGSQASMQSGAAAWTTDTNMASCGISGHSGPSRGPVQKVNLSPSKESVVAHSQGDAAAFGAASA